MTERGSPRARERESGPTPGGSGAGREAEQSPAGHPAPQRGNVSNAALWFGIFAAPAAWSVQSLVNFGVAAHACYPGLYPLGAPNVGGTWMLALVVSVLAVAVGTGAGFFAHREWTRSRGEVGGATTDALQGAQQGGGSADADTGGTTHVRSALEIGEGRTRFMAMSGILTSVTFVIASLVHGIALFVVPACGL
ncbi:hypothetical protein tb265_47810 [Gemmatimonadetes bacterium T265]|nr:hypothetical protein tb265_47810 [Gemmatimonadetes bacterium T265]